MHHQPQQRSFKGVEVYNVCTHRERKYSIHKYTELHLTLGTPQMHAVSISLVPTQSKVFYSLTLLQMFLDLGERHLIRLNSLVRGRLLGRGAFGFVFKGTCRVRGTNETIQVAMKMLQPVPPGPNASHSAIIAYKVS